MSGRTAASIRKAELAQIHIAKQQLGLDRETYEAMLWMVARVRSAADLDLAGRAKVLAHLRSRGFKVRAPKGTRSLDISPMARKVRALWLELHGLGAVHDPSEAALAAYVRRVAHVDALQWADGERLTILIETLKKWIARIKSCDAYNAGEA